MIPKRRTVKETTFYCAQSETTENRKANKSLEDLETCFVYTRPGKNGLKSAILKSSELTVLHR